MKKIIRFFIDLATAIKFGLIRIFPKPSIYLGLLTALVTIGCCGHKQITELVKEVRTDTFYNNSYKHDSVYMSHERTINMASDTVYITDATIKYKYRVICDTIKIIKRDTIPSVQTVEIVKSEPYVPLLYKISFIVLSIIVVSLILYYLWRKLF